MQITKEQKEFIENIIKECPGYKGNEYLLDEFCNEVIRRAYSFVSDQRDLDTIKVYLKRIANLAVLEVVKTSQSKKLFNKSDSKEEKDQENCNVNFEFNENSDILLNYDITIEESSNKQISLNEEQIKNIKKTIKDIEENNTSFSYSNLFELRYLNGLNNTEIAQKLEVLEDEIDKKLLFMLNKVRKEFFCSSSK